MHELSIEVIMLQPLVQKFQAEEIDGVLGEAVREFVQSEGFGGDMRELAGEYFRRVRGGFREKFLESVVWI